MRIERLCIALAIAWASLAGTAVAHAQWVGHSRVPPWREHPWPERPRPSNDVSREEGQEQRLKSAAGITGLSFGVMSAGLVTYIISQTTSSTCGITGCFPHENAFLALGGESLLAFGAGMAAVSLPTMLDAMWVQRRPPRKAGRMGWGLALTSVGVGSAASMGVLGLALHRAENAAPRPLGGDFTNPVEEGAVTLLLIVQGISAAAHLGVGIPLWAGGGRSQLRRADNRSSPEITIVPNGTGASLHVGF